MPHLDSYHGANHAKNHGNRAIHRPLDISSQISGDFDGDGEYGCEDVDGLVAAIAGASDPVEFDLTDDGQVDQDDLNAWLSEAGEEELASGSAFLNGDANLDGAVDTSDFNIWNENKFNSIAAWCSGDFNADGAVDGLSLIHI